MDRITASAATLMEQAPMTTNDYMRAAIENIDSNFGKGYAKEHSELVAAYIKTCALDFATASITSALQDIAKSTA